MIVLCEEILLQIMLVNDIVTIAIPVYERFDFFINAYQSIVNQTVKPKVLVVDNNSSHDKFLTFCRENEVPYFRNSSNLGMFGNWNRCFELAESEYVMILGDDDFLEPTFIEKFLEAKNKHTNIDVWFSNFKIFNYSNGLFLAHKHILPFGQISGLLIQEYGIKYSLGFPVISSIIKKSLFTGFYEIEHGSNDWVWIYENAQFLTFHGEEMSLVNYGKHEKQDSKNSITHLKCIASLVYLYDQLSNKPVCNDLKKVAKKKSNFYLNYFLLNSRSFFLNNYLSNDNMYAVFLNRKLSFFRRNILFIIPYSFKIFLFKIYLRLNSSVISV
jgi:glycosyltransferase involved in cell wall biosynthesis